MNRAITIGLLLLAAAPTAAAYAAMTGLGIHRQAPVWAVSLTATLLVFGPALIAASQAEHRLNRFALTLMAWSGAILIALPVYFPGERTQAVATGLSLVGLGHFDGVAQRVANGLPAEPTLARPEVPVAVTLVEEALPPPTLLAEHEIALPYEGEGRRLAVPIAVEQNGKTVETWMMLDTGATYTTLPESVLSQMGISAREDDPEIRLHTANGERTAHVVLVDTLWLGDLPVHGVAIATCEACESSDTAGLLGLNVTNGFNLTIDADRREVVFSSRAKRDRALDVQPFLDLDAHLKSFTGGRVEVVVDFTNTSRRKVLAATASILCGDQTWLVEASSPIEVGETIQTRRRLPQHPRCESYEVALSSASW